MYIGNSAKLTGMREEESLRVKFNRSSSKSVLDKRASCTKKNLRVVFIRRFEIF